MSRLSELAARELVARLPHRPGERGERWTQLLGETTEAPVQIETAAPESDLGARVAELERGLAELRDRVEALGG